MREAIVKNSQIIKDCVNLVKLANQAANSPDISIGEFTLLMTVKNMNTAVVSNSEVDPGYYLDLIDQLRESELVQNPTQEMIKVGKALFYVDKVQYVGPVMEFNILMGLDEWTANSAYPIYDVICQDDKLCPQPTIAFRVVGKVGGGVKQVIPINLGWVPLNPKASDFKIQKSTKEVKEVKREKTNGNPTKRNKSSKDSKVTH